MITPAMLRHLPTLREFSDAELEVLVDAAPERAFAAGALLMREGEIGRSCFVIVAGEVEVIRASSGGARAIAQLAPGAIVGQVALVDRGPRSASVRAVAPVIAIELSRDAFERLLAAHSPLALRFQEQIAVAAIRQLRAATERLAALLGSEERDALERVRDASGEWGIPVD